MPRVISIADEIQTHGTKVMMTLRVDDKRIWLPRIPARIVTMLGIARKADWDQGWVPVEQIYSPYELCGKYIYHARMLIARGIGGEPIFENNRRGSYRMVDGEIIINWDNLSALAYADITEMVETARKGIVV